MITVTLDSTGVFMALLVVFLLIILVGLIVKEFFFQRLHRDPMKRMNDALKTGLEDVR